MRLHRFLVEEAVDQSGYIDDLEIIHQIHRVLKMGPGQEIAIFNQKGQESKVEITEVQLDRIYYRFLEKIQVQEEKGPKVTLACAIIKGDHFELVAQKATEIGVHEIIPILTSRVVKKNIIKFRIEKIIIEAAEQSGRVSLPILGEPIQFKKLLDLKKGAKKIFLDFSDNELGADKIGKDKEVVILVGPEGGWSPEEIKMAEEECVIRSLGKNVLRTETAAIVGSYIAVHQCGNTISKQ